MSKPSDADRLSHIIEAIEQIQINTKDLNFEQFSKDYFLQLGVERCLEIISEASRHIPDDLKDAHPTIPWRRVADIGNRIRHTYHAIDSGIIWEIVSEELSILNDEIVSMMSENKNDR